MSPTVAATTTHRVLAASLRRSARITSRRPMHTSSKPTATSLRPTSVAGPAALAAAAPAPAAFGRLTLAQPRPRPACSTPHAHYQRFRAAFSTSASRHAKNQVFTPVRNNDTFQTYLAVSSSSRIPLLTLWTASWCPTCRTVEPLIRSLVESGVGEEHGGVALALVEFDSPDIMSAGADGLAMTYMITAIPTLLSFDAGEAQTTTKVTDGRQLADREFLTQWIQNEARRHGGRGGGGSSGLSFGGLFGRSK
ncbi:hypothetical protein PWT90_08051 [Aphanocladium album]|nr:hypothetical protein PWT90_08051 [Aphanocladium album]